MRTEVKCDIICYQSAYYALFLTFLYTILKKVFGLKVKE